MKGCGLCRERHCLWAVPLLILDFAVLAAKPPVFRVEHRGFCYFLSFSSFSFSFSSSSHPACWSRYSPYMSCSAALRAATASSREENLPRKTCLRLKLMYALYRPSVRRETPFAPVVEFRLVAPLMRLLTEARLDPSAHAVLWIASDFFFMSRLQAAHRVMCERRFILVIVSFPQTGQITRHRRLSPLLDGGRMSSTFHPLTTWPR